MVTEEKVWNPTAPEGTTNPFDVMPPLESDRYLTVDEIDGDRVRLVISPWPSVDSENRLLFPVSDSDNDDLLDDPTDMELIVDGSDFHAKVTVHRTSHQQPAPDRPLRVGDAFWFRAADGDGTPVEVEGLEGDLIDITFAARAEAKAAMAWAVTGSSETPASLITAGSELDEEEGPGGLETPQQGSEDPARPSVPGSVASPSV